MLEATRKHVPPLRPISCAYLMCPLSAPAALAPAGACVIALSGRCAAPLHVSQRALPMRIVSFQTHVEAGNKVGLRCRLACSGVQCQGELNAGRCITIHMLHQRRMQAGRPCTPQFVVSCNGPAQTQWSHPQLCNHSLAPWDALCLCLPVPINGSRPVATQSAQTRAPCLTLEMRVPVVD